MGFNKQVAVLIQWSALRPWVWRLLSTHQEFPGGGGGLEVRNISNNTFICFFPPLRVCFSRETPVSPGAREGCTKCLTGAPPPAQGTSALCSCSSLTDDWNVMSTTNKPAGYCKRGILPFRETFRLSVYFISKETRFPAFLIQQGILLPFAVKWIWCASSFQPCERSEPQPDSYVELKLTLCTPKAFKYYLLFWLPQASGLFVMAPQKEH